MTAAAPTWPSLHEPSVNTLTSAPSVSTLFMACSLLLAIQVVYAGYHLGPSTTASIFSIWRGLRLYVCMISWSGVRCFLTYHVATFHTFGARVCVSGMQVSLVVALYISLDKRGWNSRRFAWVSSVSFAVVKLLLLWIGPPAFEFWLACVLWCPCFALWLALGICQRHKAFLVQLLLGSISACAWLLFP